MKRIDIKTEFRPTFFWDAADIDSEKHAAYIITRILEFGDIDEVHKLRKLYTDEQIGSVVKKRRGLSPRTGKFWALKLGIPLTEVSCLKKYYPKEP